MKVQALNSFVMRGIHGLSISVLGQTGLSSAQLGTEKRHAACKMKSTLSF